MLCLGYLYLLLYNLDGMVINRITRSPFGALIHQTNDDVWLPFGFQGAVEEPTSGATIFNGNDGIPPYDSHIGQVDHLHMVYFFIFLYYAMTIFSRLL